MLDLLCCWNRISSSLSLSSTGKLCAVHSGLDCVVALSVSGGATTPVEIGLDTRRDFGYFG